jgi:hypothetical protein
MWYKYKGSMFYFVIICSWHYSGQRLTQPCLRGYLSTAARVAKDPSPLGIVKKKLGYVPSACCGILDPLKINKKFKKTIDIFLYSIYNNHCQFCAGVAELADAQASGACGSNIVWVQVPSPAFEFHKKSCCGWQ